MVAAPEALLPLEPPPLPDAPTQTLEYAPPGTAAPSADSLGQRTSRGLVLMTSQTLLIKGVNFFGQILLARLLLKEDFGLVGLTYTVASFAYLLRDSGLYAILISRQKHFSRWATPVFWMSLALGTLAGLVMMAAAPLAVGAYGEPRLWGLLLVLAVASPLGACNAVPMARLLGELRFGTMAAIQVVGALTTTGLSIVMAWRGYGPYSFVVPSAFSGVAMAALMWVAAPARIGLNPRWRRWRFLIGDSWMLMAVGTCWVVIGQGDYVVLGRLVDKQTVGLYFLAFNLSTQTGQLIINNLRGVLFPALSRLRDDPAHQTASFLRATRLLCYVGMPLCLLQAALAGPGLRLFFGAKWEPAVPLLQVLSLATAASLAGSQCPAMIQAMGRFGAMLRMSLVLTAIFLPLVYLGGSAAGATGVAAAVLVTQALSTPLGLIVATAGRASANQIARLWFGPMLLAGATVGAAWALGALAGRLAGGGRGGDVVALVATTLLAAGFYVAGLRRVMPAVWAELLLRLLRRG